MKTAREILLGRHQAATSKLDQIRQVAVAELTPHAVREPELPFVLKLWHELIWPCRRTWAGIAAAWLAILVFNSAQSERSAVTLVKSATPPSEMCLALREQRRVIDELIGPTPVPVVVEPPRRPTNQPRSERRSVAMA